MNKVKSGKIYYDVFHCQYKVKIKSTFEDKVIVQYLEGFYNEDEFKIVSLEDFKRQYVLDLVAYNIEQTKKEIEDQKDILEGEKERLKYLKLKLQKFQSEKAT